MFSSQKSFEKSLRSSPSPYQYQVPIITPLKTEIHKGCTGKAHACGSIKNTNAAVLANKATASVKAKAKSDNKAQRKNSLSSETVSDSGSESWNSNKDNNSSGSSLAAAPLPLLPPKPLKRTKSVNNGSPANATVAARRRTSDSVIGATDTKPQSRGRLTSDGDESASAAAAVGLRRSSSFRSKNIPPLIPPQKPKINGAQSTTPVMKQNGFTSGRLRNSFRALRNQNQVANWNALWESSFSTKLGGGSYRVLDKNAPNSDASKVNQQKQTNDD